MRRTVIILSVFLLPLCGYGQKLTGQETTKTFTSDIRPNEEIVSGKIYTDTLELVGVTAYEYYSLTLKKDNREIEVAFDFVSAAFDYEFGDMLEIQWKIDEAWLLKYDRFLTSKHKMIGYAVSIKVLNNQYKFEDFSTKIDNGK